MKIYTLSNLLKIVDDGFKKLFEDFEFWFESEISKAKYYNYRIYLDLVELDENGQTKSKAKGVIFNAQIWKKFLDDVGLDNFEKLKGYKLLFNGKFSFHYEYGFSIYINQISSEYVIGQFQKSLYHTIQELKRLGIYDNNKAKSYGFPPYNIAIISSKSSEGLKDFISILDQSKYFFGYRLYDCAIHGNDAKTQVHQRLRDIYKDIKSGQKIDFIAIIRGGGGSTGIIWQNDLDIAKGVCHMQVPVIVAVGHTSDRYILDDVAKFSTKTPSEAAYMLINIVEGFINDAKKLYENIINITQKKLVIYKNDIRFMYTNINFQIQRNIKILKDTLTQTYKNICSFSPENIIKLGYAIIKDSNGKYLNKKDIENLQIKDILSLKVYDKDIIVEVKQKL